MHRLPYVRWSRALRVALRLLPFRPTRNLRVEAIPPSLACSRSLPSCRPLSAIAVRVWAIGFCCSVVTFGCFFSLPACTADAARRFTTCRPRWRWRCRSRRRRRPSRRRPLLRARPVLAAPHRRHHQARSHAWPGYRPPALCCCLCPGLLSGRLSFLSPALLRLRRPVAHPRQLRVATCKGSLYSPLAQRMADLSSKRGGRAYLDELARLKSSLAR